MSFFMRGAAIGLSVLMLLNCLIVSKTSDVNYNCGHGSGHVTTLVFFIHLYLLSPVTLIQKIVVLVPAKFSLVY